MEYTLSTIMTLGLLFFTELLTWLGFITGSKSFPQPLSSQEEKKYIDMYKNGSEEAQEISNEKELALRCSYCKNILTQAKILIILISIGTIGLIKAITTFGNDKKGSRLATYASRYIENEILMNLRATKKIKMEVSLQDQIGIDLRK